MEDLDKIDSDMDSFFKYARYPLKDIYPLLDLLDGSIDGTIDKEALIEGMKSMLAIFDNSTLKEYSDRIFTECDLNKDGVLHREEWMQLNKYIIFSEDRPNGL